MEEWRPIPGWPNYQASNLGRVKGPLKILKPQLQPDGYLHVTLYRGQETKVMLLHRAVCMAFHGEPPFPSSDALHKNHIKADCTPDNLYWGIHQQNMDDKNKAGRGNYVTCEDHPDSKLNWAKVREMRRRYAAGEKGAALAREFGISQGTCSMMLNNKTWKIEKDPFNAIAG